MTNILPQWDLQLRQLMSNNYDKTRRIMIPELS